MCEIYRERFERLENVWRVKWEPNTKQKEKQGKVENIMKIKTMWVKKCDTCICFVFIFMIRMHKSVYNLHVVHTVMYDIKRDTSKYT